MNSGFITPKRVVKRVGIHQRFDTAAYHMIEPFLKGSKTFPALADIIHFEGYNGPDGLKVKSPDVFEPSHLYDPANDSGEVPQHLVSHYGGLVHSLRAGDTVRAAFEASWLAHYVCDGMTPAHHWPLEEKIAEAAAKASADVRSGDAGKFAAGLKKNWAIWGIKGHLSTHHYYETGVAFALLLFPVKPVWSEVELERAQSLGPVNYFKAEAREIGSLNLYERFYHDGWTPDIAGGVKNNVAPQTARTIGLIWLLAFQEANRSSRAAA